MTYIVVPTTERGAIPSAHAALARGLNNMVSSSTEHILFIFIQILVEPVDMYSKVMFNSNSIKSYKIVQKLSPKHAARGVAQSPYPTYRHGKVCLSKQPTWRAAGDPRLARGRSRVRAPGPAGALRALFFFHPPFLPPSGDSFFSHLPHQTCETCG